MIHDIRFAIRMIAKHRWFSAAVIVTLALGIGINSTVFTLVNAVLFKPLDLPGGERLVTVAARNLNNPSQTSRVSWPDYLAFREQNRSFEGLEAVERGEAVIVETGAPPERFSFARVTPELFGTLRTPVAQGRGFGPADGTAGAERVALISHRVWQQRYAGTTDIIGRHVRINGVPASIVGVMPGGFRFPKNEDVWMPLVADAGLDNPRRRSLEVFGLLRPDASIDTAQGDLAVIAARLAADQPDTHESLGVWVRTFHDTYNGGPIKIVFLSMLVAVGFVLLIACANVANMMLARAIARGREIAVRVAVGASRRQIIRQLLVESLLLSAVGGGLGLAFSGLGLRAFDLATAPMGRPYWITFEMDWRAARYFAGISIASGVFFGLVPALRASRVDLTSAIKEGTPGGGGGRNRFAGALIILQFALTVVLLAGAGAMVRSFFAAREINAFTQPDTLFTARVQFPEGTGARYESPAARREFIERLLPAMAMLPGVSHVAAATSFPGMGASARAVEIEGRPITDPQQPPMAATIVETDDYLPTIGLPLLSGRGFEATDGEPGREAAIVSRAFAARHWPTDDPVGRRFRFRQDDGNAPWMTVVGVCADMEQNPADPNFPPVIHVPHRQQPLGFMGLLARTSGDANALTASVRAAVRQLDEELPLFEARTLEVAIGQQQEYLKVFGSVFTVFAIAGLLMASVGIYGVIAHHTARRTREIGIRMALGATSAAIARMVVSRGLRQLGIGLALGLAGALAATQVMASAGLLLGVNPHDPLVFAGVLSLLTAVGLSACWLPARRAAGTDPNIALRSE